MVVCWRSWGVCFWLRMFMWYNVMVAIEVYPVQLGSDPGSDFVAEQPETMS